MKLHDIIITEEIILFEGVDNRSFNTAVKKIIMFARKYPKMKTAIKERIENKSAETKTQDPFTRTSNTDSIEYDPETPPSSKSRKGVATDPTDPRTRMDPSDAAEFGKDEFVAQNKIIGKADKQKRRKIAGRDNMKKNPSLATVTADGRERGRQAVSRPKGFMDSFRKGKRDQEQKLVRQRQNGNKKNFRLK